MKTSSFLISNRRNGQFQFSLKDNNSHEILRSEGYSNKIACLAMVEFIKKNCANNQLYQRDTSQGKFFFEFKTSNGYKICTSEMFDSEESMEKNIELIKTLSPDAAIDDQVAVSETNYTI